jgi:hypothetical protein
LRTSFDWQKKTDTGNVTVVSIVAFLE